MKFLKYFGYFLVTLIILALLAFLYFKVKWSGETSANMELLGEEAPALVIDGYEYRDLNKNGKLDTYEDD